MSQVVEEATVTKFDKAEIDGNGSSVPYVDVLVCGVCHVGFHFIKEFEEHKASGSCKKVSLFRDQNIAEKPDFFGFLLWRNSQAKHIVDEGIREVYQMWGMLPKSVKCSWMEAGKIIYSYEKLAKCIPKKVFKLCLNNQSLNDCLEEKPPKAVTTMKLLDDIPLFPKFMIEKVVARRFHQKKKRYEYLLKWQGYPPEQNSWEPAENMQACYHLIKQFEDALVKNNALLSTLGKRPGRPKNIDQIKPKVSLQTVRQNETGRPMKSNNQKAVDQVKFWCDTIKAEEKIFETKPIQQNVLKRDYAMLEDEDTPVLKKKYFHQDSKDEDWDDPTKHKSNASICKNVEIFLNHGNIFSRDQLTKKEHFIFNVPIRSPAFPVLKREERVKQIINNLSLFVNIHKNSDSDLIQTSPYKTQVALGAMKGFVKLNTYQVPQSGIYLFSATDGFCRLSEMEKTKLLMMTMNNKYLSKPKRAHIVYANEAKAIQSPVFMKTHQSSPLVKSYAYNKLLVQTTKTKTTVKPTPVLPKVDAANPEFKKYLPQKHPGSTAKSNENNVTLVPQHTDSYRVQVVQIPPSSSDRLTLCHITEQLLMKADGEKAPEPTSPSSPQSSMTIVNTSVVINHHENFTPPTIIKLEPEIENSEIESLLVSNIKPEKIDMNCTSHMQPQVKQSLIHYKDIPAPSNSGLNLKKKLSLNNNSNESLYNSLNVPAQRIQDTQVNVPEQQTFMTDESRHLILSADNADSMITITGDDGLLYQISAAQLAVSSGTELLAGNGEEDGQKYVFLTNDSNSVIQSNTNQEGMIAPDEFGNFVNQVMPEEFDLKALATDEEGNVYMIDNETGQYFPVFATEQEGQVVLQLSKSHTQEPQVMHEQQPEQLIVQIVGAGEPAPGGGPRKVFLQLTDGSLVETEMDEEQFATFEMENFLYKSLT